jgi:Phosphoesterase family
MSLGPHTRSHCPPTALMASSMCMELYGTQSIHLAFSSFTSVDYVTPGAANYTYYARKHSPLIIYDSIANVPARKALHRNFNDFAADINASAIPQWVWITPNLVNDGHDTDITFAGKWLNYFLVPLLKDTRFNDNRTLILLTCDENETFGINNQVFSLLLGGAVPQSKRGTTDSTYHTHYSSMSTVQANWKLMSLGRGDTNKLVYASCSPLKPLTKPPQGHVQCLLSRRQRDWLPK